MEIQSFALEQLEDRALFSCVAPLAVAPTAATTALHATARAASHNPLSGPFNVAGTYTQPFHNPDVGPQYDLTGAGRKNPLGRFTMTGHIQTPGFVNNGRSSGKLVLSSAHGKITLILHGPPQPPGSLPPTFSYTIKKGTGSYANSRGKGHLAVSASDTTKRFVFRFNQATT